MKTYSVNGTYGSSNIPCIVFVYENRNGTKWLNNKQNENKDIMGC